MKFIMEEASRIVLDGFTIRADLSRVRRERQADGVSTDRALPESLHD